jgi:hypothetical protein
MPLAVWVGGIGERPARVGSEVVKGGVLASKFPMEGVPMKQSSSKVFDFPEGEEVEVTVSQTQTFLSAGASAGLKRRRAAGAEAAGGGGGVLSQSAFAAFQAR